jgi:monofunctional biosynthetic peptidoglycan transglycosylase
MKRLISNVGNTLIFMASGIVLLAVIMVAGLLTLPDVGILEKCFTTSMYKVRLCPQSKDYVPLKNISPYVLHAVIAAEDGAFYSHKGFDWHEMQESFETNLKRGHIARGGSTLTQQLAKNAFLNKEKSFWRKIKEAYLAHAIENRFRKDFILEKYLNVVELGPDIYGVKPAALKYFQKSPSELHPLEAAYLAFLLPNPKLYSQSFRKGALTPFATKMIKIILKRMNQFGKLSPAAYRTALAHIGDFPWHGLSLDSFEGTPTHDLDAPNVPSSELTLDEDTLDEIIEENERAESPAPTMAAPAESESKPEVAPVEEPAAERPADLED